MDLFGQATVGVLLTLAVSLPAQTTDATLAVDSLTAAKNLISMAPPVYPIHAKQLHIQGTVDVELTVDVSGRVTSVRAVAGPVELQQGAIDAFFHARYKPFLNNGKPSAATIKTKINFKMDDAPLNVNDAEIAKQYFELHDRCETLIKRNSTDASAVCLQTVEVSKKLSPDVELESRAVAYDDAAKLLFEAGRVDEAVELGREVVPLVAPAGRISQASVTAHKVRSQTGLGTGDVSGGIADIDEAVEILKQLKFKETSPVFKKMFTRELKEALQAKSGVLRHLGRTAEANAVDKEAARQ